MEENLPNKKLLRVDEVATFLRVSPSTVYFWCQKGQLKFTKLRHTIRVFRESVVEYCQKGQEN